jgi:hypothetical protein
MFNNAKSIHHKNLAFVLVMDNYYLGDQIKMTEMGRACSTYGDERCIQGFWGNLRGGDHLEDAGVHGRMLKWLFKKWVGVGMDWINLAQDRDK